MMRAFAKLLCVFPAFGGVALQAGNPVAAFEGKDTLDFGSFPANIRQCGIFKILNKGDAPLKIINIRKTCGCAAVKIDKQEIKPGDSAALTAETLPDSISGPFSKNLYVESNDPKQRFLQLNFTGRAIPLLTVYPKNFLYMGTLAAGKEYEYKFRIDAERDGVKLETGPVKANFKTDIKLARDSQRQFTLTVKAFPQQKNELLSIELELKVLEPSGWKPLPIKLQGRTGN
jgi:hypothetical protein